jgi:hypothetical protein
MAWTPSVGNAPKRESFGSLIGRFELRARICTRSGTSSLDPPDKAMVFSSMKKSQVQLLERTQPVLSLGLGYIEGVADNYIRHRRTTLVAAMDVANGTVLARCGER